MPQQLSLLSPVLANLVAIVLVLLALPPHCDSNTREGLGRQLGIALCVESSSVSLPVSSLCSTHHWLHDRKTAADLHHDLVIKVEGVYAFRATFTLAHEDWW